MTIRHIFRRIIFYPFGVLYGLHLNGKNGSRDYFNKVRFKGAIIDNGCGIDVNSIIHPHVHLLENCIVNNSIIHSYTYLGKNCLIQNSSIGKFCSIANDVCIGLGKHPTYLFSTSPLFYRKKNTLKIEYIEKDYDFSEYENIYIGHDVWIGLKATILDGVTIGHGAIIASNAVVCKDVPPYAIVAGVPAKIIKYRFEKSKIDQLLHSKWWDMDLSEIKSFMNAFSQIYK